MRKRACNSTNGGGRVVSTTTGKGKLDVRSLNKMSILRKITGVTLIAFLLAQRASADSPSVTAVLTSSEAVVGQMVQLQIKVTAASSAQAPEDIAADGLEIHRTGEQF